MTRGVPYIRSVIVTALLVVLHVTYLKAQIVGNPIASLQQNEWGVGFLVDIADRTSSGQTSRTYRAVLNQSYGVNDWVTVSGLFGSGSIRVDNTAASGLSHFKGSNEVVYGGLVKADVLRVENSLRLFTGGGALRMQSLGKVQRLSPTVESPEAFYFDWKEYWLFGGARIELVRWDLFVGAVAKNVEREDRLRDAVFSTGFELAGFAGLDLKLSHNFLVNLQVIFGRVTGISIGFMQRSRGRN